jgi:hypothetical protein
LSSDAIEKKKKTKKKKKKKKASLSLSLSSLLLSPSWLKEYHTRRRRENKYVTSSKKRKSTTFDEKSFHSLADVWLKKKEKFLTDTFDIFLSSNHNHHKHTN